MLILFRQYVLKPSFIEVARMHNSTRSQCAGTQRTRSLSQPQVQNYFGIKPDSQGIQH
jgi:hypothetical protein